MTAPSPNSSEPIARVGDVVAGKFRIERVLGEGGMGVVVAARHMQLDERVALKFLRPSMSSPEMVARFAQEARAAVKLKSEHVARVLDVGMRQDGVPFIVMEYLQGQDLSQLLREGGPLPPEAAADLAIQVCEGLAEAHARGVVHRDIKPENLFLAEHGDGWRTLKILDFGISKAVLTGSAVPKADSNIRTQSLMGSPCYMSPEQLRSTQSVDHRTDLWSLGVVLYELLTGETAYSPEQSLTEVIACILEQPPPTVRAMRPDVPPALDDIVAHCMERDRDVRFQNAAELAIALMPLAPRHSRMKVERAVAVTRAAGLSDAALVVPSSIAPPPGETPSISLIAKRPAGRISRPTAIPGGGSRLGPHRLVASLSHSALWETFVCLSPGARGELAVLKRVRRNLSDDAAVRGELLAQARVAMRLDHPGVVRTFDAGEQDGFAYFVTDYVEGQALDAVVWAAKRSGVRLPPLVSTRIVADVLAALEHAHEMRASGGGQGVVHNHLGPRNVLLTYDGEVRVVDFAVARAARQFPQHAPLLRETTGYLAPEQLAGEVGDARADLYSAGIVWWELLADRRLLRADISDNALQRFAAEAVPSLTDLVNDVDPALASIVARAVHKDRQARFQSAREMREAIEGYLASQPPLDRSQLAAQMQGLFALTRQQTKNEIDAFVRRAQRGTGDGPSLRPGRDHAGLADTAPFAPPADAPVAVPSVPPPPRRRGRAAAVFAAVVGVAAVAVVAYVARSSRPVTPPGSGTASASVATPSASAPASSEVTATATTPEPTASAVDVPSAVPAKKHPAVPAAPPRPHPGQSAPPPDPGLDIRMQR